MSDEKIECPNCNGYGSFGIARAMCELCDGAGIVPKGWNKDIPTVGLAVPVVETFGKADVQAWVDGLGEKERAMMAYVAGEREFIGQMSGLSFAIEACAQTAREHAAASRDGASRAVRGLLDVLAHAQRVFQAKDAMAHGRLAPEAVAS